MCMKRRRRANGSSPASHRERPSSEFWKDYTISARFAPESDKGQSGIAFRYRNDRCYYFFGVKGAKAILKVVNHATAFHKPDEKILAERQFGFKPGEFLTANIRIEGDRIRAELGDGLVLEATDSTFAEGKVGLTADVPTKYSFVKVTAGDEEVKRVRKRVRTKIKEEAKLQAANPKPVAWKKFSISDYGVGRNLRFGDLDADGEIDVLFGQVLQHGPKDRNSELSCLTAVNLDGKVLWQKGKPDGWKNHLTNDVGFQIHDIDNDGKDEVAIGYSMFDDDGTKLWSLDAKIKDHADGIAVARFNKGAEPIIFYAASDAGAFYTDLKGSVLKRHFFGYVQNPAVANLRDDLPGLEIVSINFWGNQGIINYFDSKGEPYHDFEPVQHGSMCLPINWTGKSEEFFVLSPDVTEGGMYDGLGRRVVQFPADGHLYQCNAVLDATGVCRDEVVVWDPYDLWVYTQDDNPKQDRLYAPQRNPLYNYSNYQATVSCPAGSSRAENSKISSCYVEKRNRRFQKD